MLGRERWNRCAGREVVGRGTTATFFAGLGAVVVALASPLDAAADTSLTAHMIQHVLLLAGAGPLLAFGFPVPTMLWGLPTATRGRGVLFTRPPAPAHEHRFAKWGAAGLGAQGIVM